VQIKAFARAGPEQCEFAKNKYLVAGGPLLAG
jgi:hypothetical protein